MNDRIRTLLAEIDKGCRKFANPALAAKYARYFVEGYDAYGVKWDDPVWVKQKESWLEANRDLGLKGFLELGVALFATCKYEHGAVAQWFAGQYRDEIGPKAFAGIGKWFDGGVRNWAHCDVVCGELLAPRLECGAVKLEALQSWRASPHKYKRRAVPVALLGLLGKRGQAPLSPLAPLLEFLRPLMLDAEKVVQQGLGWFLREAWKKQPAPVEAFLLEYKDTAGRIIFQYATEKMTAAQKERFRRAKPAGKSSSSGRKLA
jgi:3-methyladenine DNA glycosylase AlkD